MRTARSTSSQLGDLLKNRLLLAKRRECFLDAAQNARLLAAAERYYRAMYYGGAQSWNLRDTHMFETLRNTLDSRGSNARLVVWAHNSHIDNASTTEMGGVQDEINLGQLCRAHFGDAASRIGFSGHHGTVTAATEWGGEMEVKAVRPSQEDSFEYWMHCTGLQRFVLDLRPGVHDALRERRLNPPPAADIQVHLGKGRLRSQPTSQAGSGKVLASGNTTRRIAEPLCSALAGECSGHVCCALLT